ncbi:hypothetical protein H5410_013251 [Solanum commersonii]|uniref:Uncharacterized protein n=1 Tax=Solanum commersonii TaxID=4109 RepID=A0A9J6AUL5_SOLCO|nr:hypothetical protein H5410_013251 [Solanum commersonii]
MVLRVNINQIEPKTTRLDMQSSNCRNRAKALTRNYAATLKLFHTYLISTARVKASQASWQANT